MIPAESGGNGIVTNLYAWTALLLALLTFGMETTFFRFAGKEGEDAENVFSTSLKMVMCSSLVFLVGVFCFLNPISNALGYSAHPEYLGCFALITSLDTVQAIMFARLRQQKRPIKFVILKTSFIAASIILNLFVFLLMPKLFPVFPGLERAFIHYDYGVGFIFLINLICTACITLGFIPEIKSLKLKFDGALCRRMLKYTWPILLLSVVGILNQVADKILFKSLMPGQEGLVQLGIYGACAKIAMIMAMLTQAFRYAYEPIVFGEAKGGSNDKTLADGMKWFIIFSLLAFLGVIFYLPILKYIIGSGYRVGLGVVPVVMLAELFMGVYFNLSFWYKLNDQTWWGAIINTIAAAVMITVNVIFVPKIGYWACAWGGFAGYGTGMLISYFIGQKKHPIQYDYKCIAKFVLLAGALWAISKFCFGSFATWLQISLDTILILVYCFVTYKEIMKLRA